MLDCGRLVWLSLSQVLDHIAAVRAGDRTAAERELIANAAGGVIVGYYSRKTQIGYLPRGSGQIEREVWRLIERGEAKIDIQRGAVETPRADRYYDIEWRRADVERLWPAATPQSSEPLVPEREDAEPRRQPAPGPRGGRRAAYRPHLKTYLRGIQQQRGEVFASISGDELWAGFSQWSAKNRPAIPLPKDRRKAVLRGEAIRDQLAAEQQRTGDQSARKPSLEQVRPPKHG